MEGGKARIRGGHEGHHGDRKRTVEYFLFETQYAKLLRLSWNLQSSGLGLSERQDDRLEPPMYLSGICLPSEVKLQGTSVCPGAKAWVSRWLEALRFPCEGLTIELLLADCCYAEGQKGRRD